MAALLPFDEFLVLLRARGYSVGVNEHLALARLLAQWPGTSSPEFGEAKEVLTVDYAGPAMQICFNAQYVLDFLGVVATDTVALDLKDEVSQAVMTPVGAEGYDYTYVIMPMRV